MITSACGWIIAASVLLQDPPKPPNDAQHRIAEIERQLCDTNNPEAVKALLVERDRLRETMKAPPPLQTYSLALQDQQAILMKRKADLEARLHDLKRKIDDARGRNDERAVVEMTRQIDELMSQMRIFETV